MERLENYRKQIIEEERQRLLREHASKLLGYLPKVTYIFFFVIAKRNSLKLHGITCGLVSKLTLRVFSYTL